MRFQRLAIIGAICWAALVGYLFLSGSAHVVFIRESGGPEQRAEASQGLAHLSIEGERPFLALAFPVILAAVPLFAQRSRRMLLLLAGILLFVFSILGAASGGTFYLPAATLLLLAAIPRATSHVPPGRIP